MRSVFVTVGTTSFDDLVETICLPNVLDNIKRSGYEQIIIQYGRGATPNLPTNGKESSDMKGKVANGLLFNAYRFKSSLEDDMRNASLIISHAGAGSIMEGLSLEKLMLVVINSSLMDNHQTELAYALSKRQYLCCVDSPAYLKTTPIWNKISGFKPDRFKDIPWHKVAEKVDELMKA